MAKGKVKIPKFHSLEKLDAWAKKQKRDSFDRKEKKVERKRIKKALKGG